MTYPLDMSGLVGWWQASHAGGSYQDGDHVDQWVNRVSGSWDWIQPQGGAQRPVYHTHRWDHPVMAFRRPAWMESSSTPSLTSPYSVFLLHRFASQGRHSVLRMGSTSSSTPSLHFDLRRPERDRAILSALHNSPDHRSFGTTSDVPTYDTFRFWGYRVGSDQESDLQFFLDGRPITTQTGMRTNKMVPDTNNQLTLGGDRIRVGPQQLTFQGHLDGDISDILIFDRGVSPTEAHHLWDYFHQTYGISPQPYPRTRHGLTTWTDATTLSAATSVQQWSNDDSLLSASVDLAEHTTSHQPDVTEGPSTPLVRWSDHDQLATTNRDSHLQKTPVTFLTYHRPDLSENHDLVTFHTDTRDLVFREDHRRDQIRLSLEMSPTSPRTYARTPWIGVPDDDLYLVGFTTRTSNPRFFVHNRSIDPVELQGGSFLFQSPPSWEVVGTTYHGERAAHLVYRDQSWSDRDLQQLLTYWRNTYLADRANISLSWGWDTDLDMLHNPKFASIQSTVSAGWTLQTEHIAPATTSVGTGWFATSSSGRVRASSADMGLQWSTHIDGDRVRLTWPMTTQTQIRPIKQTPSSGQWDLDWSMGVQQPSVQHTLSADPTVNILWGDPRKEVSTSQSIDWQMTARPVQEATVQPLVDWSTTIDNVAMLWDVTWGLDATPAAPKNWSYGWGWNIQTQQFPRQVKEGVVSETVSFEMRSISSAIGSQKQTSVSSQIGFAASLPEEIVPQHTSIQWYASPDVGLGVPTSASWSWGWQPAIRAIRGYSLDAGITWDMSVTPINRQQAQWSGSWAWSMAVQAYAASWTWGWDVPSISTDVV